MSKQYNKGIAQKRRKAYVKRKKEGAKAKSKTATSSKPAA